MAGTFVYELKIGYDGLVERFVGNYDFADLLAVFLKGSATAPVRDDEPDVVIVYSTAPAPRQPRSPRSAPGRTGARATREVGVRSLLRDSSSLAELKMRFREEAVL